MIKIDFIDIVYCAREANPIKLSGSYTKRVEGKDNKQAGGGRLARASASGAPVTAARPAPAKAAPRRRASVPEPPKQGGAGRLALVISVALIAVLCLGSVIAGYMVTDSEKIFPNVSIGDVQLGGLTQSEAARKLEQAGFGSNGDKIVTVALPMNFELRIEGSEAGAATTPLAAAVKAYDYGRDGNLFQNLMTYFAAMSNGTRLDVGSDFTLDEEYVSALVAEAVKKTNAALIGTDTKLEDERIIFIKGSDAITVDHDEIMELIRDAFARELFEEPIEYVPEVREAAQEIDFAALFETIHTEPLSAEYNKETGEITDHREGVSFDIETARLLWGRAQSGEEVEIPLIITLPEVTSDELRNVIFADILGEKSTSLAGSSSARVNNITLAAAAINGVILNPGDEFSYNEIVGQRTAARGYQAAGAYNNGKVVSEIGGGICQVSSTLYYVALLSNLEIVERWSHMFAVGYLPLGLDATVSWPNPQFRFKNDRDYPIKIEAYTDMTSYTVTVKIHGTDVDGSYVIMKHESWGATGGTGAVTYRELYDRDNNLIVRTKEADSFYQHHPEDEPSPSPKPSEKPEETSPPETTPPSETTPPPETTPPVETSPPETPPPTVEPPPETPPPPPPDDGEAAE